jgi:hypothetical protein
MPNLEATFETLVDTFVFLDKNKDGYVSKNEMVQAINETTSGERSSGRIAMKRFGQLSLPHPLSIYTLLICTHIRIPILILGVCILC